MKSVKFSLIPFSVATAPEIKIAGTISRQDAQLKIQAQLTGNLAQILIPLPNPVPTRKFNLWEETCLEFFLRLQNTTEYWEFNLAPSGDWNVFHFLNYRQNLTEESAYSSLELAVSQLGDVLSLDLEIDLEPIIHSAPNLDVAITTVIQNSNGELSYWALNHPTSVADFHHQDSFLISF